MNKKAFVLMETIVVIVVISVALLTIFASYNKILSKVKTENKYDTSEYIYMTKYIKDYFNGKTLSAFDMETSSSAPVDLFNETYFSLEELSSNVFNIKKIYLLTNINKVKDNNLAKFDAYMIDYIRKLDVESEEEILVVEYQRTALESDGNQKKDYVNGSATNLLYETYVASLEWK